MLVGQTFGFFFSFQEMKSLFKKVAMSNIYQQLRLSLELGVEIW